MKAIVVTKPGPPDVLQLSERPIPEIASDEILVRIAAAGVNRPDVAQRKGNYPAPFGAPADIPGLEIAGVVDAVGERCVRFKPGDKVCALTIGGGYAEYCAIPEGQCLPIPLNFPMIEAASLPETYFTVWSNVFQRGHLKSGETFLVHGGSGGIGSTAIQLATTAGAKVIATAGSDEKCRYCLGLGATHAINYSEHSFKDAIKSLPDVNHVDVILDSIGGTYTNDNLEVLGDDGRLVLINYSGGAQSTISLNLILSKRLTITGSTLRSRSVAFKSAIAESLEQNVWPWLNEGRIKPVIDFIYPLEKAADAHTRMESRSHMGKIVLQVF